jgi:hypothetical protein
VYLTLELNALFNSVHVSNVASLMRINSSVAQAAATRGYLVNEKHRQVT